MTNHKDRQAPMFARTPLLIVVIMALTTSSPRVTIADSLASGVPTMEEAITYSTYLASDDTDEITDVAVDPDGNAYVVGGTFGRHLPIPGGGRPDSDPNYFDAYIAKFAPRADGDASLVFATYLGGDDTDEATSVAVDPTGNVYIAGWTFSTNFPSTVDIHEGSFTPGAQAFVVKLAPNGSIVYSTTIGGSDVESASGIAVDAEGNAYVTGQTWSSDFPTVHPVINDPGRDYPQNAFVAKLNPRGTALVYST